MHIANEEETRILEFEAIKNKALQFTFEQAFSKEVKKLFNMSAKEYFEALEQLVSNLGFDSSDEESVIEYMEMIAVYANKLKSE